jgi:transposase-like protein
LHNVLTLRQAYTEIDILGEISFSRLLRRLTSPVGLSFRNLEAIIAERNPSVDHVIIPRCIHRYAPELKTIGRSG